MKKPTSKSASATPRTSSPCGTSAPMADTAKGQKTTRKAPAKKVRNGYSQGGIAATLHSIDERLKAMTPEEFRASLVRAGIIGKDGKLTPPYARPKKKKS